jgi:hypothetical protein
VWAARGFQGNQNKGIKQGGIVMQALKLIVCLQVERFAEHVKHFSGLVVVQQDGSNREASNGNIRLGDWDQGLFFHLVCSFCGCGWFPEVVDTFAKGVWDSHTPLWLRLWMAFACGLTTWQPSFDS